MDFISGCIGGTAGCLVTHPLDTIKVRLQCQPAGTYKGIIDCFKQIVQRESFKGLYKGLAPPLLTLSLNNAICFGTFGTVLRSCEDPTLLKSHFFAGAVTGALMSPLVSTVELIKCKMQMQGIVVCHEPQPFPWLRRIPWNKHAHYQFSGPWECTRTIYRREGVVGLSRGLIGTSIRKCPGIGIYFATFEGLQQLYITSTGADVCPVWYLFLAGGSSGCLPWTIFYPVDVIKSRLQCDGRYNPKRKRFTYEYSGYADCLRKSVKAEGLGMLYRGWTSTLLRSFPNNGVILTVVSLLRTFYASEGDMVVEDISSEM